MIHIVRLGRQARRQLRRTPGRIVDALDAWIDMVETEGLEAVRRIPGYHDEPLRGKGAGQRSIRLNVSYRAIYEIQTQDEGPPKVEFVSVEEVSKHEY